MSNKRNIFWGNKPKYNYTKIGESILRNKFQALSDLNDFDTNSLESEVQAVPIPNSHQ